MRETNLNATSFFFGGISQGDSRSASSVTRKVVEYKTDLPEWQGKGGAFLRVNDNGDALVWEVIDLERLLRQFPKLQADVNGTSRGDLAVFGDDYRTIQHEPLLNFSENSLSVNTKLRIPWAALNVSGDAFFHAGDGDTGLRIQNGIARNKYGFSDQYGNMVVLTNEQGKSNAAVVIGDVIGPRSSSTVFGISISQDAESPSTGDEQSWMPRLNLNGSGDLWVAGSLFQSSDERLKRDVVQTEYGLQQLLQMRPVQYIMKDDDSNRVQLGFIAQEIERLIPEVVVTHNGYKSIAYDKLIPVLVKAIQELHDKFLELPDVITAVEVFNNRMAALETQQEYFEGQFTKLGEIVIDLDQSIDNLTDTVADLRIDLDGLQREFFEYAERTSVIGGTVGVVEQVDNVNEATMSNTEVTQDQIEDEIDDVEELLDKLGSVTEEDSRTIAQEDENSKEISIFKRALKKIFSKD